MTLQEQMNEMLYGRPAQPTQNTVDIPRETAAEIETIIAQAIEHDKTQIARITAELQKLRDNHFTDAAIAAKETELKNFKDMQAAFNGRMSEKLAVRRKYEEEQRQAIHADQVRKSEEAKALYKEHARVSWLANGGHPDEFEAAFPALWSAELTRRMTASDPNAFYREQVRRWS